MLGQPFMQGFAAGAIGGAIGSGAKWGIVHYGWDKYLVKLGEEIRGDPKPGRNGSARYHLYRNSMIHLHENADGTLEAEPIRISYSSKLTAEDVEGTLDSIESYYAKAGIILHFEIVGSSDSVRAGTMWLGTCDESPGACGDRGMGAAERGGRQIWLARSLDADNVPAHEFGHIFGFPNTWSGLMGGYPGTGVSPYMRSRIESCYIQGSC
jgi:hypothetical protein